MGKVWGWHGRGDPWIAPALGSLLVLILTVPIPSLAESLSVAAVALLKGAVLETAPSPSSPGYVVPPKKLPVSVSCYLLNDPLIDFLDPAVQKASRQALAPLGQVRDEPMLLAQAARVWCDLHLLQAGEGKEASLAVARWKDRSPSASQMIREGSADAAGRVRVRIALLRAMGVPARECWFRGAAALQFWIQFEAKSASRLEAAARPQAGAWILDSHAFYGEQPDAWAMDAAPLEWVAWEPRSSMQVESGLARAYYALNESMTAEADWQEAMLHGALPLSALDRGLPVRGASSWLMLALHQVQIAAEPLPALNPLDCLMPYVPRLKTWDAETPPAWRSVETLHQGAWAKQAERVRGKRPGNEWKSPPPALGMLHFLGLNLKR